MTTPRDELIAVLLETRAYVARPDADFSWSSWKDAADALSELDGLIASVRAGGLPRTALDVLFLPTGPLQETAMQSGWSDAYLALAARFDAAIASL